ncbi:hypothetical protein ANCCAN_15458 [Ancylostoma caninum]|uniref:Uncharacterized protein n=1 Tax=Ancylostoma caninum TaxID=29170 RepID=A0A368G2E1_ANCCA|nr:hypothetical protein ANCCAN_15458 [Ancylostoma caninum]
MTTNGLCAVSRLKRDMQEDRQPLFCDGTSENVAEFVDVEEV